MELEVLGLGVAAPLGSGCPCYAVRTDSTQLVLDFGPGAHERAWERGFLGHIDAIVISHMHLDHMLDLLPLSGAVTEEAIGPRGRRPVVYVPRDRGREVLIALAEALSSPAGRFDTAFDLREYDENDTHEVGDLRLTFVTTAHALPALAPRVTDGKATLVYSADAAYRDSLVEHATGADLLLLEATYLDPGPNMEAEGHMTAEQAAELAERAGARRLVLTHLPPFAEENEEKLRRARARFGGDVHLATRGAVFRVGR